ncbi:MAG: hypothetical protein ACREOI_01995 [bacterium]
MAGKCRVVIFLEDSAQEALIPPLFKRLASDEGFAQDRLDIDILASRGGVSLKAFGQFFKDARRKRSPLQADLLIVGSDANCKGFVERRESVLKDAAKFPYQETITAIPDPHVERWYLLDTKAFALVIDSRIVVTPPEYKCEKNHYKTLLRRAFLDNNISPPLGGIEYGPAIAQNMDLYAAAKQDHGLADFIEKSRSWLKRFRA